MRAPTAAWRRAPLLLLRLPALGTAVAAAALVLALATASAPLFVASSGNAALALSLDRVSPEAAGVTVETLGTGGAEVLEAADLAVRGRCAAADASPSRPWSGCPSSCGCSTPPAPAATRSG